MSSIQSLTSISIAEAYREFERLIDSPFACGGIITIRDKEPGEEEPLGETSAPVNVFWCSKPKLVLPLGSAPDPSSSADILEQLVKDCEPAKYGRGQEDILDPEYRRAGKMNPTDFATSFHPTDFGILENVERILLPNVSSEIENSLGFRKLSAELYELNVSSWYICWLAGC